MRVSVVATGIESTAKPEVIQTAKRFSAAAVAGRMAVARAFEPSLTKQAPVAHAEPDHYDAPLAPVADEVTIRPLPPRPSFFEPIADEAPAAHHEEPIQPFLPPRPERAEKRLPRMPRIDELPMPGQRQVQAARGEIEMNDESMEQKRMTLLERLSKVGIGRRSETPQPQAHAEPEAEQTHEPVRRAPERPQDQGSEYARRPAGRGPGMDTHGRSAAPQPDSDELEIPAFLRRQA